MFTILAHGVKNADPTWSIAQHKLIHSGAPVRICSAPTGAGKTRVFLDIAKTRLVFFIVPTQALAKDIEKDAQENSINAVVWDYNQTLALLAESSTALPEPCTAFPEPVEGNAVHGSETNIDQRIWQLRSQQFDDYKQSGGMIICTLEVLARLTFSKPIEQGAYFDVFSVFSSQAHIVFDEAHTLNARAFGLLHLWILLTCILHHQNDAETRKNLPKLNLLSATHSNLFQDLKSRFLPEYQPYIDIFDEQILPLVGDLPFPELVKVPVAELVEASGSPHRWIHGNVDVIWQDASLLDTVKQHAAAILAQGQRLLLIYDSMYQFAQDETALAAFFRQCGLDPEHEVYAINGMDKKAGRTQGGGRFPSGLNPQAQHRVIIGTSAVEMGVNFKHLNHAIIEHGIDAATLLQRIGRVARGPNGQKQDGLVYVCRSAWAGNDQVLHVEKLKQFNGDYSIQQVRQVLEPLRDIDFNLAQRLGGAYWSMLMQQHSTRNLIRDAGLKAWQLFSGKQDNPCAMLNALHAIQNPKPALKTWLKEINKTLQDVRGFTPAVKLKFADNPIIEYEEDWVMRNLIPPDDFSEANEKQVLIYHRPRDECLLDKKRQLEVSFFSPVGTIHCKGWNQALLQQDYLTQLKTRYLKSNPERDQILQFIASTGLLPRDASVEKGGDYSEMVL